MTRANGLVTLAFLTTVTACAASGPTPSPDYVPPPSHPFGIPAGYLTRIESIEISADDRVLTMRFTGGREGPASEPCTNQYEGWALLDGDLLRVAVVQLPNRPAGEICPAIGYAREVEVTLDAPFIGNQAEDQSTRGFISIQRAPEAHRGFD